MEKIVNLFISSRAKSLYWRSLAMVVAGLLSIVADNLDVFSLSPQMTVLAGLIVGEFLKAANNWVDGKPLGFQK